MDKKQVYCRYCGKLIDEDAPFCTYCGKKQDIKVTQWSANEVTPTLLQSMYSLISKFKKSFNKKILKITTIWAKRIFIFVITLTVIWLLVLLGAKLYGLHLASQWNEEDERLETIALNDITKADTIARSFLYDNHVYDGLISGLIYSQCRYDHNKTAIKILKNATEKGNADAQCTLGLLYCLNGLGTISEQEEFRSGFTYPVGFFNLETGEGKFFYSDDKKEQLLKKGAYLLHLAAEQGHSKALFYLGELYYFGWGVKKDLVKATDLFLAAADKGQSDAQLKMGDMLRDGEACFRVITDSIRGEAYIYTAKPNIEWAKRWWNKALKNGNKEAKDRLEQLYE